MLSASSNTSSRRSQSAFVLTVVTCMQLSAAQATAVELTEKVTAAARERRDAEVARAKHDVKELERQRSAAAKERNFARIAAVLEEIKKAKLELARVSKKTIEEYAQEIELADGNANEAVAIPVSGPERADEPEMAAQNVQPDPEEEKVAAAAEAERRKLSGGCPLKIQMADFYHVDVDSVRRGAALAGMAADIPSALFGECTFLRCTIKNCLDEPVEAHELLVQFVDGFDEVVGEKVLQGTLLKPQEERTIKNGWGRLDTAVQVRVFLQRTKLSNGQIWRREPHHEQVGATVKKPQGAELGKSE